MLKEQKDITLMKMIILVIFTMKNSIFSIKYLIKVMEMNQVKISWRRFLSHHHQVILLIVNQLIINRSSFFIRPIS